LCPYSHQFCPAASIIYSSASKKGQSIDKAPLTNPQFPLWLLNTAIDLTGIKITTKKKYDFRAYLCALSKIVFRAPPVSPLGKYPIFFRPAGWRFVLCGVHGIISGARRRSKVNLCTDKVSVTRACGAL
jgi:hypothetical protein